MLHNPYSRHYFHVPVVEVPLNTFIPHCLKEGKQILVSGYVPPNANRFWVNLHGPQGISLHINPRFDQNLVARNSCVGEKWDQEITSGEMPFVNGQNFEMLITVLHDRYKIDVNGRHMFDHHFRLPMTDVSHLEIRGDVILHKIIYSGGRLTHPREHLKVVVPCAIPLHEVKPNKLIQILGTVPENSNRFHINLQKGSDLNNGSDISLHMSIRYNEHDSGDVIVRNHRKDETWGSEERFGTFMLARGCPFEMVILCTKTEWKIAVNGVHFASFVHRLDLTDVDHLTVQGDVQIKAIREF